MKRTLFAALLLSGLLLVQTEARAQNRWFLNLTGTSWKTNAAGKIVSTRISNQTFLEDYVANSGRTSTNGLALAYHANADNLGDAIDVVDSRTGEPLYQLYGLYLGTVENRLPLFTRDGREGRVIQYIYGYQITHSVGSAEIIQRYDKDAGGNTNRVVIQGQFHFLIMPDRTHEMQVITGNFTTGKPVPTPGT